MDKTKVKMYDTTKALKEEGFTLMEVMIAMTILAIALVAVFQSLSQSISLTSETRFLTTASLLAQSKMAEVENRDLRELRDDSGKFGENFSDYLWRLEIKDTMFEYLKKIDLTITNGKAQSNNVYQIELYKFIGK